MVGTTLNTLMILLVNILTGAGGCCVTKLVPLFPAFTLVTRCVITDRHNVRTLHTAVVFDV